MTPPETPAPFELAIVITVLIWTATVLVSLARRESKAARVAIVIATVVLIAIAGWRLREPYEVTEVKESLASVPFASCASVRLEMTEAEVRATLGNPTLEINDEDIRGPSAGHWVYEANGCRVHFVDRIVRKVD